MELIDNLIKEGWLKTPVIIEAFRKIKRIDFLPEDINDLAELNDALPIGFGQTISQPLVVAFMLELLELKEGEKILDVGSGSGWTSALLGEIVGKKGKVISMEIVPELCEFGEKNVAKYNFPEEGRVQFICADGSRGYPNITSCPEDIRLSSVEALAEGFDKILVSAAATILPDVLEKQLKIGGRIVLPINSSIWLFAKKSEDEFDQVEYPGFVFVPLITK